MRKILIGVAVLAMLAVGGYFGTSYWAQLRAEREVEAAFDAMRSAGMTAAHGAISFDLVKRTLVVADVVVQSNTSPPTVTKVGRITATGVGQPEAGRISAERLDLADIDIGASLAVPGARISYLAPRLEVVGYSGPAGPLRTIDASSAIDLLRGSLEYFAATTASSVTIPRATATMRPGTGAGAATTIGAFDVTYSDIVIRDLRERRVATINVERAEFSGQTVGAAAADIGKISGEIAKLAGLEVDLGTILALFDPAEAGKGEGYRRAYRQLSAGPYRLELEKGGKVEVDSVLVEDVGYQPSKFNFGIIVAMIEMSQSMGATPSPVQTRQMLDRVAAIYEGMRIGKFEARGISAGIPPSGQVKLAAFALKGFENGRLGELTLEGMDVRVPPQDPVTVGRFSLVGLHLSNGMRAAGEAAAAGGQLGLEQRIGMLRLLEGISLSRVSVPIKPSPQPVFIDTLDISWGQFVGAFPTRTRFRLKATTPVQGTDEFSKLLVGEGVTSIDSTTDLSAAWTEAARTFAVALTVDGVNWMATNLAASVGNVPRDIFTVDPIQATGAAMGIELGPVEFVFRDTGIYDVVLKIVARQRQISVEETRKLLLIGLAVAAEPIVASHQELKPVVDAATKFLEASKATFSLKVVPNGQVTAAQLVAAMQTDPFAALPLVKIDAATTR